ncbi:MAG: tRNA (adenosine(37)-N6)-threonylcarbamoyltransferase complex transferase subunit TsaD [Patescibacteria group bacterium]|nr:tRNA (adenosine(37)-N6)-threonylcarbamoyltransferase complex transferase subunit TsaD [Patescibacteria group bacterium]
MIILALESSCDETAAAILKTDGRRFDILSEKVWSQINIHKKFGGVVPEVAARNHVLKIIPVLEETLIGAGVKPNKLDAIAVTAGPGLITSLIVGVQTAKTLAYAWHKPLIPVNHVKAHLYANWLNNQPIKFPAIGLIVSGGHTELILLKNPTSLKKIGATVDDAAGEAFDKTSQLLKLGYPGGVAIALKAEPGDCSAFNFPRPMINAANFNFSFSGLKTAVLYATKKINKLNNKIIADLCASFEQAVVDTLTVKTIRAAHQYKAKTIILAGGVAANKKLRITLQQQAEKNSFNLSLPLIKYCTDNAAMIAAAGYFAKPAKLEKINADPSWEI